MKPTGVFLITAAFFQTSARGLSPAPLPEQALKPSVSLILESANSNENNYSNGEFISELHGNVVFLYDSIRIRSDEATWRRKEGTVIFRQNITVTRGHKLITCDRLNFTKENSTLTASGRFNYFDTADQTRLTGDHAEYHTNTKIFTITGNPVLFHFDTTARDTLTIKSLSMRYEDSLKRAMAMDSVRITKGQLSSACNLAHFFTKTNYVLLRGVPRVRYGVQRLIGDSINLDFAGGKLRHAVIVGNSHGIYADTSGEKKHDTSYTHIWGDSLDMVMSDSGKPQVLWAIGKASSKSFERGDSASANKASGKIMMLAFAKDGNVRNLEIWGNARSTYFVNDSSGRGCNEVSGDSVSVLFANSRVQFVTLEGSTRGVYFPLP
ncbi:MAG: LptA/OstA family protein [Chitinispirillaceae bacterium]